MDRFVRPAAAYLHTSHHFFSRLRLFKPLVTIVGRSEDIPVMPKTCQSLCNLNGDVEYVVRIMSRTR
jgi:hypothetical protein